MKKILLSALLALTASTAYAHDDNLPKSGFQLPSLHADNNFNENWQNRLIANWSLQQLNATMPKIYDPYTSERIYNLTAGMNAQVRSQALLAVPIINSPEINAFAVPGGLIGINSGTILTAQAQDEYASVLAHEIAHLAQRHYEHNKDNKNKLLALQLGGLLTAIAASAISGDGAAAAMIGSQAMTAETAAAHSREHEKEADRVGMQIMAGAGLDVRAMPRFFDRLHRQTALNTSATAYIPSFAKSHPLTAERLSEATARANTYPIKSNPDKYSKAFDLLKWRLKYLTKTADLTELTTASKVSMGAKLALIAHLSDLRQFDKATALFNSIDEKTKNSDPLFCITAGHIAYEQNDFNGAVKALAPCQALYPERRDLAIYLADAYVFANDDINAEKLLAPLVKTNEHDTLAWDLLQKNYENRAKKSSGNAKAIANLHALRSRGKQELWYGNYDKAINTFANAQDIAKNEKQLGLVALLDKDKEQVRLYRDLKIK